MDTIKIPDGWERVPFNKDTVIQEGWKFDSGDETWVDTMERGCNMQFPHLAYIRPIPAPVAPEGYEIAPDDHVLREGIDILQGGNVSEMAGKKAPAGWGFVVGSAGQIAGPKKLFQGCARPIVPAAPAVSCPACGKDMERISHDRVRCLAPNCELYRYLFTPAFIARLRVEPEPLVCPRCGGSVTTIGVTSIELRFRCVDCWVSGPKCTTRAEAESEFRKLEYRK